MTHADCYIHELSCGHARSSPSYLPGGTEVTCPAHGQVTVRHFCEMDGYRENPLGDAETYWHCEEPAVTVRDGVHLCGWHAGDDEEST